MSPRKRPPLTDAAQAVWYFSALTAFFVGGSVAGLVATHATAILVCGGSAAAACAMILTQSVAQVRRHGWREQPGEQDDHDDDGWGRGGNDKPRGPHGDGGGIDWDRFCEEFWSHVRSGQRQRDPAGVR